MKIANAFIIFGLLLSFSSVTSVAAPIDPKNLEVGCNEDNAPEERLTPGRLLINDGGRPYVPCDKTNMGYRVRKAMMDLGKMIGMNGNNRWNKSIIGYNPFDFVASHVDYLTIIYEQNDACDPMTNGYFQRNEDTSKGLKAFKAVTICPSAAYGTELDMMALMLHEARHADNKIHDKCAYGPLSMTAAKACDKTIEYEGSYAVSTEFYLAAMREPSLTPAQRQQARSQSIAYLVSRFNKLPKDLSFVGVMYPAAGGAYVYDGQRETKIISQLPAGFEVVTESLLPTFINKLTNKTRTYDFKGDRMNEWPNQLTNWDQKHNETFVDRANIGNMSCFLFTHRLACWSIEKFENTVWNFNDLEAVRFMVLDNSLINKGSGSTAYIVKKDGHVLTLPMKFDDMKKIGPSSKIDKPAEVFAATRRDIIVFPKDSAVPYPILFITHQGDKLLFAGKSGKVQSGEVPGITQLPIKRLIGPTVWSDLLEKL